MTTMADDTGWSRIDEDQSDGEGIIVEPPNPDEDMFVTVDEAMYAMTQVLNGEWTAVNALAVLRAAAVPRTET